MARLRAPSTGPTGSHVLDDVAEVIGLAAALKLSWRFRGQDIYIPKNLASNLGSAPQIVEAIGQEAAEALADCYGGITLPIPRRAGERAMVLKLAEDGMPRRQIADTLGIGERQVYRIINSQDDRQLRLMF